MPPYTRLSKIDSTDFVEKYKDFSDFELEKLVQNHGKKSKRSLVGAVTGVMCMLTGVGASYFAQTTPEVYQDFLTYLGTFSLFGGAFGVAKHSSKTVEIGIALDKRRKKIK